MLIKEFTTMKKILTLLLFILSLSNNTITASPGDSLFYDIKLTLTGIKTPKVLLGFYAGDQTYLVDSTIADLETSALRFKPSRPLAEGMYFVANTEGVIFDLILSNEMDFTIVTKYSAPYDSAQISKSRENTVFFEYMHTTQKTQNDVIQLRSMISMLRRAKADRATLYEQQVAIKEKYEGLDKYTLDVVKENPSLLVSKLLNITTTPLVPSDVLPILENKKPNPAYWTYFRQHFFDGVDFTDKRLLKSPYYSKRLEQYLGYVSTNSEQVKEELDFVLEKTRTSPDFYRYTLNWLTALFDNNLDKMYNADAYLIHLVEKYHRNLDSGTDKYLLERLEYKANAFKKALIGSPAPAFSLPNTEGVEKSLTDINSEYTLLIFYSSLCSHCRTSMPIIQNSLLYTDSTKIKVCAVCTDGQRAPWLSFVEDMKMKNWLNVLDSQPDSEIQKKYATWNLPVLFLLDKNKKILANRVKIENLPELLRGVFETK
jgi:peroxiredoxin